MKTRTRFLTVFGVTLAAVLLFSGTAFAEGEAPPEAPATDEALQTDASPPSEPIEEAPSADEAPPPEETLAVDEPVEDPVVEEISPDNTPSEETPVEEPPVAEPPDDEIPAGVPVEDSTSESDLVEEPGELVAETALILVDAEGQPLEMASQESAAVLGGADPYWKVGTIWFSVAKDAAGCYTGTSVIAGTCKIDPDPIQYAIDWIALDTTKKPTNGYIYVESDLYLNPVTINGTNVNLSTLKGLIGRADGAGVYPTIQNAITISNLLTGFTLQGFTIIDGVVTFANNTGTLSLADLIISNSGGDGLVVTGHKGNVVLTRVKSSDNDGNGAFIDNSTAPGNVTITNSAFDRNGDSLAGTGYEDGLTILTTGILTINGISVSNNDGQGLTAIGFSSLSLQHAMLNGNQHGMGAQLITTKTGLAALSSVYALGNNWDSGILLITSGPVSASNIQAMWNGNMGMMIDNTGGLGTVTVKTGRFNNNTAGDGLVILSKRAILISTIEANQNGGNGAVLDNYFGGLGAGNVTVGINSTVSSLLANSFWDNTGGDGLQIFSKGVVLISDFNATDNANYGVYVRNDYGTGDVTIQKSLIGWTNNVSWNGWDGIFLLTKGNVIVKNVSVDNNGGSGLYTGVTTKSVAITSVHLNNNMWEGLYAQAIGNISLLDVTADGNGWGGVFSGVKLVNTFGTGAVTIQSPSLTSYRSFTNNTGSGIEILSKGVVTVKSIWSNNNGEFGLYIANFTSTTAPGVSVLYGEYHENGFEGLHIESKGNVLLTNVTASNNDTDWLDLDYYSGAYIDNHYGTGSVIVNSTVSTVRYEFSNNTANGLEIYSKGLVSVGNVNALDNWMFGMVVDNSGSSLAAPKLVTVARSFFHNNGADGLNIHTIGNVTMAAIRASNNGWDGMNIEAYSLACTIPAYVLLGGTDNEFINNGGNGVSISNEGYVTLSNITADWNGDDGIAIYNRYTGSSGAVTIGANSGVWNSTSHNNWSGGTAGISIETYGVVSITRLLSNDNDEMGGLIINTTPAGIAARIVTIISGNFNSNEGTYGLVVESKGNVNMTSSHIDSNEQNGLYISTVGAVNLNRVLAMNNSLHQSTIAYNDTIIYEHLTSDVEGDMFWFEGDSSIPYTITLESSRFDAYLKLYDSFGTLIDEDDNSFGIGSTDAKIDLLVGDLNDFQDYYILVTTASGWGEPGDYKLSFSGPGGALETRTKGAFNGALIDNSGGMANVTITNLSNFSGNNQDGLIVLTSKEVRLTTIQAGDNGGSGVIIPSGTNVFVTNTSTSRIMWFGNNGDYGMVVADVTGAITVTGKMEFNNNGDDGLVLINNGPGNTYGILINGAVANGNGDDGIFARSNGHMLLSNLTANENGLIGLDADNTSGTGNLTLQGYNYFYNNGTGGIEAATKGVAILMRIMVEGNGGTGIALTASGTGKAVTLSSVISQFNGGDGVIVDANGILKLVAVRSWLNGGDGIITNSHAYSTTFDSCVAIGNAGDGIDATTPANLLIYPYTKYLSMPNTWYFGNDVDGSGDLDFRWTTI